jgi:hypothetical protein
MPRFSITAYSAQADYSMKRHSTADGLDAVFKNQKLAEQAAQIWVDTLNEVKLVNAEDWVATVTASTGDINEITITQV